MVDIVNPMLLAKHAFLLESKTLMQPDRGVVKSDGTSTDLVQFQWAERMFQRGPAKHLPASAWSLGSHVKAPIRHSIRFNGVELYKASRPIVSFYNQQATLRIAACAIEPVAVFFRADDPAVEHRRPNRGMVTPFQDHSEICRLETADCTCVGCFTAHQSFHKPSSASTMRFVP